MRFGKKYSYVRQVDQTDCGAAALATIAMHYKRPQGVQKLREIAGTDQQGTNLLGMVKAAEQIGFSATAVKGSYDSLREVPLPAIAHVVNQDGLGHFVVIYSVSRKTVTIADPAKGINKQTREEFNSRWTGYLVLLDPRPLDDQTTTNNGSRPPWQRFVLAAFRRHSLATHIGPVPCEVAQPRSVAALPDDVHN